MTRILGLLIGAGETCEGTGLISRTPTENELGFSVSHYTDFEETAGKKEEENTASSTNSHVEKRSLTDDMKDSLTHRRRTAVLLA